MAKQRKKITLKYAEQLGDELGVDWNEVDLQQFAQGLVVEQEHWGTVGGQMSTVASIALDHLEEFPDYYTRLAKLEREADRYWAAKE